MSGIECLQLDWRIRRITARAGIYRTAVVAPFPTQNGGQSRYTVRLAEAGVEPSVASKSDSYDDALAGTVYERHKTKVIHERCPWRTVDELGYAILEWLDWFNYRRLQESFDNIPTAKLEMTYYRQLQDATMVALIN